MLKKKGFTLIEMMVVMGIIAVLATLGVNALLMANKASLVDSAAQDLLARIRETQNKSMAIIKNDNNIPPYVWGLHVTASGYGVLSYDDITGTVAPTNEQTTPFPAGITASIQNGDYSNIYVDYTAPFGKLLALKTNCGDGTGCTWVPNKTQTGDYTASDSSYQAISRGQTISFKIQNSAGYYRTIYLNSNGDSYIE